MPKIETNRTVVWEPPVEGRPLPVGGKYATPDELDRIFRTYFETLQSFPARLEVKRALEIGLSWEPIDDKEFQSLARFELIDRGEFFEPPDAGDSERYTFQLDESLREQLRELTTEFLRSRRLPAILFAPTWQVFANSYLSIVNQAQFYTPFQEVEIASNARYVFRFDVTFSKEEFLGLYGIDSAIEKALASIRNELRQGLPRPSRRGAPVTAVQDHVRWLVDARVLGLTAKEIAAPRVAEDRERDPNLVSRSIRELVEALTALGDPELS